MLGKPQDGSLASKFLGTGFAHPPQRQRHRNTVVPWPFRVGFGRRMQGSAVLLWYRGSVGRRQLSRLQGHFQLTAGLVLPKDSHFTFPSSSCSHPAVLGGSRHSSRLITPGSGPHATDCRIPLFFSQSWKLFPQLLANSSTASNIGLQNWGGGAREAK